MVVSLNWRVSVGVGFPLIFYVHTSCSHGIHFFVSIQGLYLAREGSEVSHPGSFESCSRNDKVVFV